GRLLTRLGAFAVTPRDLTPPTIEGRLADQVPPAELTAGQSRALPLLQAPPPLPLQTQIPRVLAHDESLPKRKRFIVPTYARRALAGRLPNICTPPCRVMPTALPICG